MTLYLILLVCALIAFVLDTIGMASRINLTPLGLALLTLAFLLGRVRHTSAIQRQHRPS
jgi:hypothetical protein